MPSQTPRRLAATPSWLLSRAAQHGDRLVSAALAADGMGKHDFRVLVTLDDHGPSSQADIGRAIMLDRSDLHAILTRLETDGLVERAPDERDRRRNVVALTRTGRATLKRLEKRVTTAQNDLLAPLKADERRQLVEFLQRLATTERSSDPE